MAAHLSKELAQKYGTRSSAVRKGDEVEIMRGEFKKKRGKISDVDLKFYKVYVDGVKVKRTDGTERQAPIHPSNLRIVSLDLSDKKRVHALEKKSKGKIVKVKPTKTKEPKQAKAEEEKKEEEE
jgi:large subunit ribosomal protein L24